MTSSGSDRDSVERLAEAFLARYRRGERPDHSEYTERYLEHTAAIKKLLPALMKIEQPKPAAGEVTGPFAGTPDPAGASAPERRCG